MPLISTAKTNRQSGFAVAAVIGMVVMLGLGTTVMMRLTQSTSQATGNIARYTQTVDTLNTLNVALARHSETLNSGIVQPVASANGGVANFSDGGLVPSNIGTQTDSNGHHIKYCTYYNGSPRDEIGIGNGIVINPGARTYYDVQSAPVFALIAAGRSGTVQTSCQDLLSSNSDENGVTFKTKDAITQMQRERGSNDIIMTRTVADAVNMKAEGASNLITGMTNCDWRTDKLVYNDVGGQAQFDCVREQDSYITGENSGNGGAGIFIGAVRENHKGKDLDPSDPISKLQFRNIVGAGTVSVAESGNNIIITGTSGTVPNASVTGSRVLVDDNGPLRLRRIAPGNGNVQVFEDGDTIRISSTPGNVGTVTGGANIGSGTGRVYNEASSGAQMQFRTIKSADNNLQISTNDNEVVIKNTMGAAVAGGINMGGGIAAGVPNQPADTNTAKSFFGGINSSSQMVFRRIEAGPGIMLSDGEPCAASAVSTPNMTNGVGGDGGGGGSGHRDTGASHTNAPPPDEPPRAPYTPGCGGSIKITVDPNTLGLAETDPIFTTWRGGAIPNSACAPNYSITWTGNKFICAPNNSYQGPWAVDITSRAVFYQAGNVGIGINTPASALHVTKDIRSNGNVFSLSSAGDTFVGLISSGSIVYSNAPGSKGLTFATSGDGNSAINNGATVERMRLTPSGQVAIGTQTPDGSAKLHVNGKTYADDFFVKNSSGGYESLQFQGEYTANTWQQNLFKASAMTNGSLSQSTITTAYPVGSGRTARILRTGGSVQAIPIPPGTKSLHIYSECTVNLESTHAFGASWVHVALVYPQGTAGKRFTVNGLPTTAQLPYGANDPSSMVRSCYMGMNQVTAVNTGDQFIPVPPNAQYLWYELGTNGDADSTGSDSRASLTVVFQR